MAGTVHPQPTDGTHRYPIGIFLSTEINSQYYFTGSLKTFIKVSISNILFAFKIKLYMAKPR